MSTKRRFPSILLLAASMAPSVPIWAADVLSISTAAEVMLPGSIPVDATDRFGSDTADIHAVALVKGTKAGERFVGRWISVDAIATPDYLIAAGADHLRGNRASGGSRSNCARRIASRV